MSEPAPAPFRFDRFEVDFERRELRRDGRPVRLQDKPFRLLATLSARPGEIVEREDLARALWPDARHLDFEANLNAAVRKLRKALGDSARAPRWLQTVPRRGYRLSVEPPASTVEQRPSPWRYLATPAAVVATLAIVLTVLGLASARTSLPDQAGRPLRLAIVPFELAALDGTPRPDLAPISEWLVAKLANRGHPGLLVVGPRTTVRYTAKPFPDLERMADELAVDYVLNARALPDHSGAGILVELIRLSDGAHTWVEFFDEPADWRPVAATIREQVRAALEL